MHINLLTLMLQGETLGDFDHELFGLKHVAHVHVQCKIQSCKLKI